MIKYSIIIPIYNASKYLRNTLDSILKQEYKNYEVILVNDGSTDDSLDICNEYKEKNKNFKVITIENSLFCSSFKTMDRQFRINELLHALADVVDIVGSYGSTQV